jgi:LacI family transcriptional regulator
MPASRVTLKDIAKQIGLSTATISRALADHPDISAETKERVRDAARVMSYIPNHRARYLRAKHSRLIVLIVPEMNMFFVPSMIAGINRVVQQNDYSLIVCQSDNSIVQERRLAEYAANLSADGVLVVLSSETSDLRHLDVLHEFGIPVALLDRTIETTKYTTITIDDEQAGREAAAYLLDRGHTCILGVFGDQRQRISAMRLQGFRRAHAERGLPLQPSQILHVTMIADLEMQLHDAFDAHPDLTAIFTMTDDLLVHAHHLLARRGVRIPEEVSLMAISDGQAPAFLHPNVTHLRHSGIEVGERTAHLLIGMIEHNSDAMMDVRIRTTLVELGSVMVRPRPAREKRPRSSLRRSPR